MLAATIAFLIVSFFDWFQITDTDFGDNMWSGIGVLAGLLALALLVWQAIRVANLNVELGVTPSMITAALAVLLAIFTFIRFIDKPGGSFVEDAVERTFWAWLGLALVIVIVAGAWLNMQAAGESIADVKDKFSSATRGSSTTTAAPPANTPAPPPPPAEPPADPGADDTPETRPG